MAAVASVVDIDILHAFRGPLEGFTHFGASGTRGDGPYAYLWLIVEDGVIRRAAFQTPGCPSSSSLGAVLCRLAIGRPVGVMQSLTADELLAISGPVPDGRGFYANLLTEALQGATEQ